MKMEWRKEAIEMVFGATGKEGKKGTSIRASDIDN